ncbi:MAG: hypothetical protein AAF367_05660 [Pseudomonadota bacterium]
MQRLAAVKATLICICLIAGPALAFPFEGTRSVQLIDGAGNAHNVGSITFTPEGDGAAYQIDWAEAPFTDHFLSMRPFKCVEGVEKHWCHVPYPYENNRHVSADDLTDLEYDLLFIWKGATEYGINMWNGVYYRLTVEGDRITGRLNEIDMDALSAPPEDGNLRPVREQDLEESDPESHWLPVVVIE